MPAFSVYEIDPWPIKFPIKSYNRVKICLHQLNAVALFKKIESNNCQKMSDRSGFSTASKILIKKQDEEIRVMKAPIAELMKNSNPNSNSNLNPYPDI